jgi:uncharacterized protein (TIGR00251 family)
MVVSRFGKKMSRLNVEDLRNCIKNISEGILLQIEVKPNSKSQGIEGIDTWRDRIYIRVRAEAEKGKANLELIQYLSLALSLPTSNISITKGATSKKKEIKILGLSQNELINRLIELHPT